MMGVGTTNAYNDDASGNPLSFIASSATTALTFSYARLRR